MGGAYKLKVSFLKMCHVNSWPYNILVDTTLINSISTSVLKEVLTKIWSKSYKAVA